MKKNLIMVISIIVIIGLAVGGFFFYTTTPEYTLTQTIKDVKSSGMNGLKEHLTENAGKQIETIEDLTDKSGVSGILSSITQDKALSFLKSRISEVDWTVEDILKGKNQTNVIVQFDYNDSIIGTIEVIMIKDKIKWKIDALKFPSFDKFSLW